MIHNYGDVTLKKIEGKGRGIIANRAFEQGETAAVSPVLILSPGDSQICNDTILSSYVFHWPYDDAGNDDPESSCAAVALGLGSMFNHSDDANADWHFDPKTQTQQVITTRKVWPGEELTVNYGWGKEYTDAMTAKSEDALNLAALETALNPEAQAKTNARRQSTLRTINGQIQAENILINTMAQTAKSSTRIMKMRQRIMKLQTRIQKVRQAAG